MRSANSEAHNGPNAGAIDFGIVKLGHVKVSPAGLRGHRSGGEGVECRSEGTGRRLGFSARWGAPSIAIFGQ